MIPAIGPNRLEYPRSQFEYKLSTLTSDTSQPIFLASSQLIKPETDQSGHDHTLGVIDQFRCYVLKIVGRRNDVGRVFVEIVARIIRIIAPPTQKSLSIFPIRLIGSDTVSPTSCCDAAVISTPRPANRNIVTGKPITWPVI